MSALSRIKENGRGSRARTYDLRFWRPPLYQLSYTPSYLSFSARAKARKSLLKSMATL